MGCPLPTTSALRLDLGDSGQRRHFRSVASIRVTAGTARTMAVTSPPRYPAPPWIDAPSFRPVSLVRSRLP